MWFNKEQKNLLSEWAGSLDVRDLSIEKEEEKNKVWRLSIEIWKT